ncbi:hypothetical protein Y1Q_0024199 [Alligator mississippiensis]|uniref:DDE Tnp4 domain-containing protein n=1 Tax=Alligator mississippiensis TaxID=8496 RepID=A0A151NI27_ALLMI|nr:hypothetical protein Y1Q_0024199 [Alligator mississippiensis]
MKREMFYHIVSMLGPHITRQDTNIRQAIPPNKKVTMAIMKLASTSSLSYITNQFGVAACTVGLATHEVCQLLKEITANNIIYLVNPHQVIDGFNEKGFLNYMKALGSIYILVLCPVVRRRTCTNRKGYTSRILQAMVDHWGWLMNIYTRWAGSAHDACMFRNFPLPGLMEKGYYVPNMEETLICSATVPLVILVDAAYPLKPWPMKPYRENITDLQKLVFV